MILEYSAEAIGDLAEIEAHGILSFGEPQTTAYLAKIKHSILLLSQNPRLGKAREDTVRPVRTHPVGAHIIAYELVGKHIRIVRILYGRSNWQKHM